VNYVQQISRIFEAAKPDSDTVDISIALEGDKIHSFRQARNGKSDSITIPIDFPRALARAVSNNVRKSSPSLGTPSKIFVDDSLKAAAREAQSRVRDYVKKLYSKPKISKPYKYIDNIDCNSFAMMEIIFRLAVFISQNGSDPKLSSKVIATLEAVEKKYPHGR
jgi:hypothetical protein